MELESGATMCGVGTMDSVQEADIVDVLRNVREEIADQLAARTVSSEFPRRCQ